MDRAAYAGALGAAVHGQRSVIVVRFSELTEGDRFVASQRLWTKLGSDTARAHGAQSVALGLRGYGYTGDPVCSFEQADSVVFVPPHAGAAA